MVKFASTMGVNFSNYFQSNPIEPSVAVSQILALPVTSAKIFSHQGSDLKFMEVARASGLTLAVGCINEQLLDLAQGNTQPLVDAIKPFSDIVAWVCVGNEPLGSWHHGKHNSVLVPAVTNVANAFKQASLDIGVTVPQNFEFMANSYPPSKGSVKPELAGIIKGTCDVMRRSGAPFMVNIYPFITRIQNRNDVPLPYCLWNAPSNQWVKDENYTYKNIFDAMLDALHVALGNIGCGDLEIVVGECGWPTGGGDQEANPTYAQMFNQGLINHCKSSVGTPRYPGKPIPCFVFEMYDEDKKPIDAGQFERHWGCYGTDAGARYKLTW
jgi:exo-beta-1,3-glucanase (GH17 family)